MWNSFDPRENKFAPREHGFDRADNAFDPRATEMIADPFPFPSPRLRMCLRQQQSFAGQREWLCRGYDDVISSRTASSTFLS